jgi:hypothetical protein
LTVFFASFFLFRGAMSMSDELVAHFPDPTTAVEEQGDSMRGESLASSQLQQPEVAAAEVCEPLGQETGHARCVDGAAAEPMPSVPADLELEPLPALGPADMPIGACDAAGTEGSDAAAASGDDLPPPDFDMAPARQSPILEGMARCLQREREGIKRDLVDEWSP